jgi:aquaporin Z
MNGAIRAAGPPRAPAAFADSRLEWRRLLAEAGGTFFLVLVAAGAGVVNSVSHGQVGRAAAVTAPGIMVLALIYTIGVTSGAHLNPAVTVAFAARGHFPWRRVPGYLLTFGLVTVILGTASGARNVGHNAAIAVGGYVALAGLWPARSAARP